MEGENVPRKISYRMGHSRVSLRLPISLKIYSNGYKSRFSLFFAFLTTFLRISMKPGGKIVRSKMFFVKYTDALMEILYESTQWLGRHAKE